MSTIAVTNVKHPSAVDPAIELDAAGKLWLAGGKILQVVRATDTTDRSTTSTSFVDASLSVTITPQKNDSAVILLASVNSRTNWTTGDAGDGGLQITDGSNNAISGAEDKRVGVFNISGIGGRIIETPATAIAYATPASILAQTYKVRFRSSSSNVTHFINNSQSAGQLFAIEVSA